jgi:hypothetical protein
MCKFASFVLTKDREYWLAESDSHEEIISKNGLHADGALGPNILRIELTPPAEDWSDFGAWNYRIDQDMGPEWYDAEKDEKRARAALALRSVAGFVIPGDLNLDGCTGLKELPENLKVRGYLSLPDHLKKGA